MTIRARRARRGRGFTLIEILAVVAILALVAALVFPNLSGFQIRALRNEARHIAAQLELARQRAIVTGTPHRMWMDLDQAEYRIEWLSTDPDAAAQPEAELDLSGNSPLPLIAPRDEGLEYRPMPGSFGNLQVVVNPFYFEGVETPGGWIGRGETSVDFERDGSASYTQIVLQDNAGHRVVLDVYPLDERVRIRDEDEG